MTVEVPKRPAVSPKTPCRSDVTARRSRMYYGRSGEGPCGPVIKGVSDVVWGVDPLCTKGIGDAAFEHSNTHRASVPSRTPP